MDSSIWITIYLPLFILLFVFLPQIRNIQKLVLRKIKKKKGWVNVTNEVIKKFINKNCKISAGSFGINVVGKIIDVKENWIEVETKKGTELINADFIQSIKIKEL